VSRRSSTGTRSRSWSGERPGVPTSDPGATDPVARLRYVHKHRHWALLWRDRNQRWHRYGLVKPTADVIALLEEIERDPTCIFWG
jgi:hypothetical protein